MRTFSFKKHKKGLERHELKCYIMFKNRNVLLKYVSSFANVFWFIEPGVSRLSDVAVTIKGLFVMQRKVKLKMKNRIKQRYNRKLKEELLSLKDECGVKDPTPYEAVKEIIYQFNKAPTKNRRLQNGL